MSFLVLPLRSSPRNDTVTMFICHRQKTNKRLNSFGENQEVLRLHPREQRSGALRRNDGISHVTRLAAQSWRGWQILWQL